MDVLQAKQNDKDNGKAKKNGQEKGQLIKIKNPVKIGVILVPGADAHEPASDEKEDGNVAEIALIFFLKKDFKKENEKSACHDKEKRVQGGKAIH
jgi:hypothetical protein